MDERIIIRHLNLGKANQAEEFPIKNFKEIVAGRDATSQIKYDPDRDDLVSRRHAVIKVDSENPLEFSIADLGSRNGTFVNKQRIFSPVKLQPGDVVQFGAGGPEFQFDVRAAPGKHVTSDAPGHRADGATGRGSTHPRGSSARNGRRGGHSRNRVGIGAASTASRRRQSHRRAHDHSNQDPDAQ